MLKIEVCEAGLRYLCDEDNNRRNATPEGLGDDKNL